MTFYSMIAISVGSEYFTEEALTYYAHLQTIGCFAVPFVHARSVKVNFTRISLNILQINVRCRGPTKRLEIGHISTENPARVHFERDS